MNFHKNCLKRVLLTLILAFVFLISTAAMAFAAENVGKTAERTELDLNLGEATLSGDAKYENGQILVSGDASLSIVFKSEKSFNAELFVCYVIRSAGNRPVELGAIFNEEQFADETLTLPRVFYDKQGVDDDVRPEQIPVQDPVTNPIRHYDQRAGERLKFNVKEGDNSLTLSFLEQSIAISGISFITPEILEDYKTEKEAGTGNDSITIQAEKASLKSDSSLSPTYDLTSNVTTPYSYDKILLNTIGSATWNTPGQWITWDFTVETEGYYCISFRARQNESRGLNSYRRISIDDEVGYKELDAYAFPYNRGWYIETLTDRQGDEMYFWLSAGKHTLKMEAVMGDALQTFDEISNAVKTLNSIYRKIIMITGTTPDTNRSYQLFTKIPGLSEDFKKMADKLADEIAKVEDSSGNIGTSLNFLKQFSVQLDGFAKREGSVVSSLAAFKSNISTLASLLTSLNTQPLELDTIVFSQKKVDLKANMNLWEHLVFEFKRFVCSFSDDYSLIGGNSNSQNQLVVWCMMGRDQAQIINNMINDTFTPATGIKVSVSVVTAGLSEAIMAKKGPDVVMGIDSTTAINLGVREALADLSEFKQYNEIISRFQAETMDPFAYDGATYAIPSTQEYNMMFVRTDIYEELGLDVCETWDDLLKQLSVFSRYHMVAGIPTGTITTMLLQNGMNYYNADLSKTIFSTEKAYDVYKDFVSFYTDYETPGAYDAPNRFRSGEMPVVIAPFSFYNTLSVLAPEVHGLWDMYMIPGTKKADGTIDRSTEATGLASAIINDSKKQEESMRFLDWWTSADIQSRFGLEIENVLGRSGRYATANVEAFNTLNWSSSQIKKLQQQRKYIKGIPGTPVSYIVTRSMNNIFYMTVNSGNNLKEMMIKYSRQMDDEIVRKYAELESYK